MKNKLMVVFSTVLMIVSLSACGKCEHTFADATCMAPKTCTQCGATEGEIGDHSWVEATCTAPKTCSVCGATEGEALEHTWEEATYSAPKTCSVCGETEGDKLEAYYSKMFDGYLAELNKPYDLENTCYEDSSRTTVGKIVFTEYKKYSSSEREAKEGYEWRSVSFTVIYGDDNACDFGYGDTDCSVYNYYSSEIDETENDYEGADVAITTPSIDKKLYLNVGEGFEYTGWTGKAIEEYGFSDSTELSYTMEVMVPVEYDGFVVAVTGNLFDAELVESGDSPEEAIGKKVVLFRMD